MEPWFHRKLVVLRDLKAKLLKTDNLSGLIYEIDLGAMPWVYRRKETHEDRLAHGEK
jgi:hypothetical protein